MRKPIVGLFMGFVFWGISATLDQEVLELASCRCLKVRFLKVVFLRFRALSCFIACLVHNKLGPLTTLPYFEVCLWHRHIGGGHGLQRDLGQGSFQAFGTEDLLQALSAAPRRAPLRAGRGAQVISTGEESLRLVDVI